MAASRNQTEAGRLKAQTFRVPVADSPRLLKRSPHVVERRIKS
jgi:hypothetical protein